MEGLGKKGDSNPNGGMCGGVTMLGGMPGINIGLGPLMVGVGRVWVALTVLVDTLSATAGAAIELGTVLAAVSAVSGELLGGASLAGVGIVLGLASFCSGATPLMGLDSSGFGATTIGLVSSVFSPGMVTGGLAGGVGIRGGIMLEFRLLGRSGTGLGFIFTWGYLA